MRKKPSLKQKRPAGRPMANAGIKRQNKRLRHQIHQLLRRYI